MLLRCVWANRFALGVVWALGASAALADTPMQPGGADLYQTATRLMEEARFNEARAVLERLLQLQPEHAGAWLDLAVLQCNAGRGQVAESLFTTIEQRFTPPPALQDVINQLRSRGCDSPAPAGMARLQVGRVHDSNVNQGAISPFFNVGSGSNLVTLVLAPEYAPRSDTGTAVSGEFSRTLPGGTLGFAQFQARQYDRLPQYNLNSVALGAEHPWQLGSWTVRANGSAGLTTLGGSVYQRQLQLQLQATAPLGLPKGWELGASGGWTGVSYPTLTGFDSRLWESRGLLVYRSDDAFLQASVGYALDRGDAQRPGNDRSGAVLSLTGRRRLAGALVGELGWSYQSWHGQQAYSPGLIDERRRQHTQILRAAVTMPLSRQQAVHVELRAVRNRENISIFEFQGKQLQVNWEWSLPH
ncbi:MAG: tetratricopeptide repeat protein [Rhodoferax sp.]|nr:tetratricopeptide repeat protein [Rhodoferax sp.]